MNEVWVVTYKDAEDEGEEYSVVGVASDLATAETIALFANRGNVLDYTDSEGDTDQWASTCGGMGFITISKRKVVWGQPNMKTPAPDSAVGCFSPGTK